MICPPVWWKPEPPLALYNLRKKSNQCLLFFVLQQLRVLTFSEPTAQISLSTEMKGLALRAKHDTEAL